MIGGEIWGGLGNGEGDLSRRTTATLLYTQGGILGEGVVRKLYSCRVLQATGKRAKAQATKTHSKHIHINAENIQ